jgi:hypothetical protein
VQAELSLTLHMVYVHRTSDSRDTSQFLSQFILDSELHAPSTISPTTPDVLDIAISESLVCQVFLEEAGFVVVLTSPFTILVCKFQVSAKSFENWPIPNVVHHSSLSFTDQTSMSPDPSPLMSWAHTGQKPRDGTRWRL